jgi:hypothetical protein
MFPKKTREFVAQTMADEYKSEIESQDGVRFEGVEIEEAKYSPGKVQKAFRSPNSYKLAKQLVNYKKNDEGWAMFRMKMHSMLQAMGTDIAKTGEISKKTKKEYGHYYDGKSLDWYQKVIQQWIVEFKKNLLDEATKWKIGDGRPRGGSHIENVRFWDLPKDQLQYIMKDADKAVKANPTARKATSGPGNWADQINDADTVLAWRKKNGIKEEVARLKEGKKNVFGENDSFAGGIIFDVDEDTFRNSRMGRNRYERWRRFVNVESEMGRTIREFHRKHSSVPIILRNEIGAMFYLKK